MASSEDKSLLPVDKRTSSPSTRENVQIFMPDSDDLAICEAYDRATHSARSAIPENLLYLVRNTEKEIKRNRLQAMIRLKNNSRTSEAKYMVELITDHFFAVHEWPSYAIEIMLSPDFKYAKRLALAAFLVGNGLHDATLGEKMFKFYNKHWQNTQIWNRRFGEFRELFKYLNKPDDDPDSVRVRSTYFYYSMEVKQTLYFNGEIRHRNKD